MFCSVASHPRPHIPAHMPRASSPAPRSEAPSGTSSQSPRSPYPSTSGIPLLHDPNLFRPSPPNRRSTCGAAESPGVAAPEIRQTAVTRTRQRAAASSGRRDLMPPAAHHLHDIVKFFLSTCCCFNFSVSSEITTCSINQGRRTY
jgi:hypothetical protein